MYLSDYSKQMERLSILTARKFVTIIATLVERVTYYNTWYAQSILTRIPTGQHGLVHWVRNDAVYNPDYSGWWRAYWNRQQYWHD